MQSLDRHDLKRRAFLIAGGQATAAALAGSTYGLRPVFAENRSARSAQEQRIAESVETYDAQAPADAPNCPAGKSSASSSVAAGRRPVTENE